MSNVQAEELVEYETTCTYREESQQANTGL
jgi:hypothetical protein